MGHSKDSVPAACGCPALRGRSVPCSVVGSLFYSLPREGTKRNRLYNVIRCAGPLRRVRCLEGATVENILGFAARRVTEPAGSGSERVCERTMLV